jgi:hypothetical protein
MSLTDKTLKLFYNLKLDRQKKLYEARLKEQDERANDILENTMKYYHAEISLQAASWDARIKTVRIDERNIHMKSIRELEAEVKRLRFELNERQEFNRVVQAKEDKLISLAGTIDSCLIQAENKTSEVIQQIRKALQHAETYSNMNKKFEGKVVNMTRRV